VVLAASVALAGGQALQHEPNKATHSRTLGPAEAGPFPFSRETKAEACGRAWAFTMDNLEDDNIATLLNDFGNGKKCRGRDLLYRWEGLVLAAVPSRTECTMGNTTEDCSIYVVACPKPARHRALRPVRPPKPKVTPIKGALRMVGLHVRVEGPALFNIQPSYQHYFYPDSQEDLELAIRLPLQPELRLPGIYHVFPRLAFWNDNCRALRRSKDTGTYVGHLPPGTFLGTLEGRCDPREKCGIPRFLERCDKKTLLPFSPISVTLHEPAPGSSQAADIEARERAGRSTQCIDGLGEDGQWVQFSGCPSAAETAVAPLRGDLCSLCMDRGKLDTLCNAKSNVQWHLVRSSCRFAYPSPGNSRESLLTCFRGRGVTHVVFLGDSIIRGLYSSLMELLSHSVNETQIKIDGEATSQHVGGVSLLYVQDWFAGDILTKDRRRMNKFFDEHPVFPPKRRSASSSPLVLFIVNLGALHQVTGGCNQHSAFEKSVVDFKHLVSDWLGTFGPRTGLPRVQGFVYGSPPVNGLRSPGYTLAKGISLTKIARETIGDDMPQAEREFPFPFHVLDPFQALLPRIDATMDGLHYGQTTHHTPLIALLNALCRELLV